MMNTSIKVFYILTVVEFRRGNCLSVNHSVKITHNPNSTHCCVHITIQPLMIACYFKILEYNIMQQTFLRHRTPSTFHRNSPLKPFDHQMSRVVSLFYIKSTEALDIFDQTFH